MTSLLEGTMRILCFIDSLGSGGAQRQLCMLAVGLKKRGHQIRFLVYHQEDHFLPLLQAADIPCQTIPPCSYAQRTLVVRHILRQGWQDVVLAFLEASSLYAELTCIPRQSWGLVVGERSANPRIKKGVRSCLRQFHRLADAVVCNSHVNRLMLAATFPFLKNKLCTIYNTADLKLFCPSSDEVPAATNERARAFRIVVAASYQENKNMMNVGKALLLLKSLKNASEIVVDWFGAVQPDPSPFKRAETFIVENNLGASFRLHHTTTTIAKEFFSADAVCLFSFFEGLPNAVCEGMACGKPILLSNVCDSGNLVQNGKNGFLCEPSSSEDIAEKIQLLVDMSELERCQMGKESRKMAERLFDENVVIDRYERILLRASHHESIPTDCNWPPEVPESARKTVER